MTENGSINLPRDVPGFITKLELTVLAQIAKHVPENKRMLEIGSLFGRSALAFLMNSHDSVKLDCIDSFKKYKYTDEWEETHFKSIHGNDEKNKEIAIQLFKNHKRFFEAFKYFTKDYDDSNRLNLRIESSQESNFNKKVEVLFIDGDHSIVTEDILKFDDYVEGLIISHDLTPNTDYGIKVFKSGMYCRNKLKIPLITFPGTSFFFLYKTKYWRDTLFKIWDEIQKG
jgi:hypothetical protein